MKSPQERIFLDHASTTPVEPAVLDVMLPYFSERYANPSALYKEGVGTREVVDRSRLEVAKLLHCRADEIIFTGSGTESDNISILGTFKYSKTMRVGVPHVITSVIEHPAVLESARAVECEGGEATYVRVGENGIVDPKEIKAALREETVLVSVMLANNEIGTIQPVSQIGRIIREYKEKMGRDKASFPYFHVDASQGPNYLECFVDKLGCDLMTLDGSKIYGPKGVGMLYIKRGITLEPIVHGGGQERGFRSGTENVPLIVGFAKALEIADRFRKDESIRLRELRDRMIEELQKKFPTGSLNGDKEERLPNNINFCFPGIDAEFAVIKLDHKGIQCSYSSSCRTLQENNNSYVIEALGKKECAASSLRFTMGRETTKEDLELAAIAIIDIIK